MGNVEPTTICYAALQARRFPLRSATSKLTTSQQTWVGISDMKEWSKTNRGVDLSMLYTALRHLLDFERGRDPWVDETLKWWDG